MRHPGDGSVGCPSGQRAVDAYGHVADDHVHAVILDLERETIAEVVSEHLALVGDERDPEALHLRFRERRRVAAVAAPGPIHDGQDNLGNLQRETLAVGYGAHDDERLHTGLKADGQEVLEHANRVARSRDCIVFNLQRGDHPAVAHDDAVAGQGPARILGINRDRLRRDRARRWTRDERRLNSVRVEHGDVRGDGRVAREREGDQAGVGVVVGAESLSRDVIGDLGVVPRSVRGGDHHGTRGGDARNNLGRGVYVGVDGDELARWVGGCHVEFVVILGIGKDSRRARLSRGELETARSWDRVHDPRMDVRTSSHFKSGVHGAVAEAPVVVDRGYSRAAHAPANVKLENFRDALQHRNAGRLRDDNREQTAGG